MTGPSVILFVESNTTGTGRILASSRRGAACG